MEGRAALVSEINYLCKNIYDNPGNFASIGELKQLIINSPVTIIKTVEKFIVAIFYPYIKKISDDTSCFGNNDKQLLIDTLKCLLDKISLDNSVLFFNFYSFLLFQIYDYNENKVLVISEEYKLSILECFTSLAQSVSSELVPVLYTKENAPKFSQMIFACGEIAKNEKSKDVRCAAINSIMALARVTDEDDFSDEVLRDQVAQVFLFFLPGLSTTFRDVAVQDPKEGHKVPMHAVRAFGRIVALVMQDYNASDRKLNLKDLCSLQKEDEIFNSRKSKYKSKEEYMKTVTRTTQWYKENDENLDLIFVKFAKLTNHYHVKVRLELVEMASLVIKNCVTTMPKSVGKLIEIVIILSEDEDSSVADKSKYVLKHLSETLSQESLRELIQYMEEGFYNGINRLPRIFNSIDEQEKISSLNLLIGYIDLFGEHNLTQVLLSSAILHLLVETLLNVSVLEKKSVSLLEEYTLRDLDLQPDMRTPWINFQYIHDERIKTKLEELCSVLTKYGALQIVSDQLLDTLIYNAEHKKEAVFLINSLISGANLNSSAYTQILKNILNTYTDDDNWDLSTAVSEDSEYTLGEVQDNIVTICLLAEGIGKIAMVMENDFKQHLLKILYLILERAGSGHPLIRAAGLTALTNITFACGYKNITELVNDNIDYFSYHVERRLNKLESNENVFSVLSVVLRYSNLEVLPSISNIVNEVLMQSCDKFKTKNSTGFLKIFQIFIDCLYRWLNVTVKLEPIVSKAEKEEMIEDFKVTGISADDVNNFSDDIMEGKRAEEMFKEDMNKKKIEEMDIHNEDEEFKKPEPPMHIKLCVAVISRSLHFLPSKDRNKRLLVLDILRSGLEIIRDWDDELLPLVHQIWSPLVQRFKEFDDPLMILCSFRLLVTLARLSKDFIRRRTTKEVLPSILQVLELFSKESYLKDKGAAYRYSQGYKLQLAVLENLGTVLVNLDVDDKTFDQCMERVLQYLCDKQPSPLQGAALEFFKIVAKYDTNLVKVQYWLDFHGDSSSKKNLERLKLSLLQ